MRTLFLVGTLFISIGLHATNYYFSSTGGDDNRTVSQAQNTATPWKSLAKLNSSMNLFQPGDVVSFKRGDVFVGTININQSGSSNSPITFTAYGTGDKPVISGFVKASGWTSVGGGIFENVSSNYNLTLNTLLINGVPQRIGRYPNYTAANNGYLTIKTTNGSNQISDDQPSSSNWTGGDVVIRKAHWVVDRNFITSHSGNTINYNSESPNATLASYGYFIQNHPKTLDQDGEWCFNAGSKKLSVYSSLNNPASLDIQASSINTLVVINNQSNLLFDNISFKGANINAFEINNSQQIRINNCDILFSGADAFKGSNSNNIKIENSFIYYTNNNGFEFPNCTSITISNNKIKCTGVFAGMGGGDSGSYEAILTDGNNHTIEFNEIDSTGYNPIGFRGSNNIIRNNFINNFNITKDDGGGIYTWNNTSGAPNTGSKITNNIILNGLGAGEGTPDAGYKAANGIYLDDNTSNVEVAGNTVAFCGLNGVYLHNAHEILMHNNTVFGNNSQMVMSEDNFAPNSPIRNISLSDNILVSKENYQPVAQYATEYNDLNSFGSFDHNSYARPTFDHFGINASYKINGTYFNKAFDLQDWKTVYSKDLASTNSPVAISSSNDFYFQYNATSSLKTFSLVDTYVNVNNISYSGSLTLQPYTSVVLLKSQTEPLSSACPGAGNILLEEWENAPGSSVSDIPLSQAAGRSIQLPSIEFNNIGDNYGSRMRGYLCPPQSGNYTFYIAGDDAAELWLSTNDKSENKTKIASLSTYTDFRDWYKYPSQKSITINLNAGTKYYIEVLQKEALGGDHVSVGWKLPDGTLEGPIQGKHVVPFGNKVALKDQTISFGSISTKGTTDAPFALSASSSSGLSAAFRIVSGPATLTNNTITLTGAGTVAIEASQVGNSEYNAAPTVSQSFNVVVPQISDQAFTKTILAVGLSRPWEMQYGPDDMLWITQTNGRISRVNPNTGAVSTIYTAPDYFGGSSSQQAQLLCGTYGISFGTYGMALHPDFANQPYIYFIYSYNSGTSQNPVSNYKVRRLTWNAASQTVSAATDIITNLPLDLSHEGMRMMIITQQGVPYIYITVGDGTIDNDNCYPVGNNANLRAQDLNSRFGKILRYNIDGSIPASNPIAGSPVFTRGHRNPLGLAYNPSTDIIYSSENGKSTDDEINIIEKGRNYGWPKARGYHTDNNYPGEANFVSNYASSFAGDQLKEAIYSWCPMTVVLPEDPQDAASTCVVAPSDMIYYSSNLGISELRNSLMVTALKNYNPNFNPAVYVFKLKEDGSGIDTSVPNPQLLFRAPDASNRNDILRYRDIATTPDGKTFFICTDTWDGVNNKILKFTLNDASCTGDNTPPAITLKPSPTVFLDASGHYTVQLSDVLQSVTDNCDPNPTASVNSVTLDCSNLGSGGTPAAHQAYVSDKTAGNASYLGEIGLEFSVNASDGITINKLGAFDDQANGFKGGVPGINVGIFNKATQALVASTLVVDGDPITTGNYRVHSLSSPVTLMPGNYIMVVKGYNPSEPYYNRQQSGPLNPAGDGAGGAVTFTNNVDWGANSSSGGFNYPPNSTDAGNPNEYITGTFIYSSGSGASNTVTVTAKDVSNNQSQASIAVTVVDTFYNLITKDITVNLNSSGSATIQPSDVLASLKNFCGVDVTNSTLQLSRSNFNCSDVGGSSAPSSVTYQAYVSNKNDGNASYLGEIGLEFSVNAPDGIVINKLGAFDDQADGFKGGIPGINVGIFNKATQSLVPGLSALVVDGDPLTTGNYRVHSLSSAVTLMPGNYIMVVKGYNPSERYYNRQQSGPLNPAGDGAGGAVTFTNNVDWGANIASGGMNYPPNSANAGNPNEYITGTFLYNTLVSGGTTVTLTATDVYGHQKQATAKVVVKDNTGPSIVTKNITVHLNSSGQASITPNDVLQSPVTDNCGVNTSSIAVSPNTFSCADLGSGGSPHQAYVSNKLNGNASYLGEVGLEFSVTASNGVVINQLGAFDDQANGFKGGIPGINVGIFNKATQALVASTLVVDGDPLTTGNYRVHSLSSPVTLMPGNYILVVKGYNSLEPYYNRQQSGPLNPAGDGAGAITFTNTVDWGANTASGGFNYPPNSANAGNPNEYITGTFVYTLNSSNNKVVTVTATDTHGNTSSALAVVTVDDPNGYCGSATSPALVVEQKVIAKPGMSSTLLGNAEMSLKAYPNPNRGQFTVELYNLKVAKVTLQIMDQNGKIIEQKTIGLTGKTASLTIPVNLGNNASGIYTIKVISTDGVKTSKVVASR